MEPIQGHFMRTGDNQPQRNKPYDLIVIGGGVHGAGVARDAALRGRRVLLVEQGDWAVGTSSRSSKLFHGGIRYLREGALGLVRESLRERDLHMKLAPHLVKPLRFEMNSSSESPPRWMMSLGVAMYHLMTAGASKGHPFAKHPSYEDARMNDARFVWELVREARKAGAHAWSYSRLEGLGEVSQGSMLGTLRDQLTGEIHEVRGRVWINATGPWASENSGASLRLTRGTHVILQGELPGAAQLFFAPEDGRVLFLLPFVPGYSLLGTTDLDEEAAAVHPVARSEEVSYLGQAFQRRFPQYASWKPVSLQCGYRPLLPSGGKPSQISREEKLLADPNRPLLSILGGKYTTYRAVSERAVDWCDRALGISETSHPTRTHRFQTGRDLDSFPGVEDLDEVLREDVVTLEDLMLRRTPWGHLPEWREYLDATCSRLGQETDQPRAEFEARQKRRLAALEAWPKPSK